MSSTTVQERYGNQRHRPTWRTFLKPGWIIAALLIVVFSYFAFTFLAPWQLNKDSDIVERNERITTAFEHEPLPIGEVFTDGTIDAAQEWQRVSLTGRYLPEDEVVLRMRASESGPAVQVLTPFVSSSDGVTYLVNRGFEPATGAGVPDYVAAPTGEVSIVAVARLDEVEPDRQPMEEQGYLQVYGINTEQISEATGVDLARDYLQLTEGQAGEVAAMPIPKLDRGSHLSYGLQWIAFGVMAPLGLGYFVYAEMRERRRAKEEEAEMMGGGVGAVRGGSGGEGAGDAEGAPGGTSASGNADVEGVAAGTTTPVRRLSRREKRKRFQEELWDEGEGDGPGRLEGRYGG
ncbi:SURF1 family protein [Corynebacterium lowii]|uniref:SURF1-like protein n=1 Tax=Corynebacterium lowii TaxID=1544413 RepID=A0A0Q0U4B5_9CORY|nr:SURF1 family protein [Corynebacterium lowii]KQB86832.1 SURF1 family protein [Corynebacterium lowii]MDP9851520.1 cytochrome oxidase assembly protein ShyY1 [Corynebacterium lowii]